MQSSRACIGGVPGRVKSTADSECISLTWRRARCFSPALTRGPRGILVLDLASLVHQRGQGKSRAKVKRRQRHGLHASVGQHAPPLPPEASTAAGTGESAIREAGPRQARAWTAQSERRASVKAPPSVTIRYALAPLARSARFYPYVVYCSWSLL